MVNLVVFNQEAFHIDITEAQVSFLVEVFQDNYSYFMDFHTLITLMIKLQDYFMKIHSMKINFPKIIKIIMIINLGVVIIVKVMKLMVIILFEEYQEEEEMEVVVINFKDMVVYINQVVDIHNMVIIVVEDIIIVIIVIFDLFRNIIITIINYQEYYSHFI